MATRKQNRTVTLPDGVSLQRVAQVLLEAWEAGAHQWTDSPLQLREGPTPKPAMPMPQDAMELFRLLAALRAPYLLAGGMAMLTSVEWAQYRGRGLAHFGGGFARNPGIGNPRPAGFFCAGAVSQRAGGFAFHFQPGIPNWFRKDSPPNIALRNWKFRR